MTYEELKSFCDTEIKKYPQFKSRYIKEIIIAKRFYDNGRNLYKELVEKINELSKRYIIPFLLGLTNEVIDLPPEMVQVKFGDSGALDIDSDFSPEGKEKIQSYLRQKYGEDRVIHVGTYTTMGPASAAKDLLRIYNVGFKESVAFTKLLNKDLTWEDNIENIKNISQEQYNFYLKHKPVLDLVPYFINKIRNCCLPYYHLVNTENGMKEIYLLDNNKEKIEYLDSNGNIKYTNNYKVFKTGKQKIFKITLENGMILEATENHIVFTNNGIKKVKDLTCCDELIIK